MPSRRQFLGTLLAASGGLTFDPLSQQRLLEAEACALPMPGGQLLGTLPLTGDRPKDTPFGSAVGGPGLDTRLFTDLSLVAPDRMQTPSGEVFVRTAVPPQADALLREWSITIHGRFNSTGVTAEELRRMSRPMGTHLIECAGNNDPNNFGLMSVADWDGVPLADLYPSLRPDYDDYGVLVAGLDDDTQVARTSAPGASWILPLDGLKALGPFLATRMNGAPLPPEHGAPVRLVVPGWYGCAWIKWVRSIELVKADALVTSQMAEFASRTHQGGRPMEVTEYQAPVIDVAATPIRVERWRIGRRLEHRIVGLVWGGSAPVETLQIRCGAREPWRDVHLCAPANGHRAWSLWSARWMPDGPGTYNISLRTQDPGVRTRRLDVFFYARRVRIDEA